MLFPTEYFFFICRKNSNKILLKFLLLTPWVGEDRNKSGKFQQKRKNFEMGFLLNVLVGVLSFSGVNITYSK